MTATRSCTVVPPRAPVMAAQKEQRSPSLRTDILARLPGEAAGLRRRLFPRPGSAVAVGGVEEFGAEAAAVAGGDAQAAGQFGAREVGFGGEKRGGALAGAAARGWFR